MLIFFSLSGGNILIILNYWHVYELKLLPLWQKLQKKQDLLWLTVLEILIVDWLHDFRALDGGKDEDGDFITVRSSKTKTRRLKGETGNVRKYFQWPTSFK